MSKLTNNPLDLNLKAELMKTKNSVSNFDLEEELIKDAPKSDNKEVIKTENNASETEKTKEKVKRVSRTYKLPQKLYNDIKKVVYMDRELRGNETTLITKALENYVYSKENEDLIKQYDEMKGGNKNE